MKWIIAFGLLFLAGTGMGQLADERPDNGEYDPLEPLGYDMIESCGLGNLSMHQRHNLMESLALVPVQSYVEGAAVRYLQKDGWKPVRIVGAIPKNDKYSRGLTLIMANYEIRAIEPPLLVDLPLPGIYLAKESGTTWRIMLQDGEDELFWEKNLE